MNRGPQCPAVGNAGPRESASFWRAGALAGASFFKATFTTHTYARHTHDDYAIGVTEAGVQSFYCRGGQRVAPAGTLILVNPDDLHDGQSATAAYTSRMVYLGVELLVRAHGEYSLQPGQLPLFRTPVVQDAALAGRLAAFHRAMERPGELQALESETWLLEIVAALLARHATRSPVRAPCTDSDARRVRRACTFIDEHYACDISLTRLAEDSGISRFALVRLFSRHLGMPPHTYLTRARLREACRLLVAGEAAASVAGAVGFVDQSHLTRRFRAAYGITPGQFAAARG
ncbi:AraC family transcriptional regulator [Aquabacterium sp. A7-Y]|uniref:AraC family transcriptional regulator n=1 Tax=Aquabacterium sp. A7-Y TaxID=1349605 RepID=UPI00223DCC03|nr:AraC family transcriptional regulator [Aquabacterium sp. A7-Y]MCW7539576.1 AraC family transcriptional regulator [Aquabacterium sp. A7-Y]